MLLVVCAIFFVLNSGRGTKFFTKKKIELTERSYKIISDSVQILFSDNLNKIFIYIFFPYSYYRKLVFLKPVIFLYKFFYLLFLREKYTNKEK